jgi:hypothetical protein
MVGGAHPYEARWPKRTTEPSTSAPNSGSSPSNEINRLFIVDEFSSQQSESAEMTADALRALREA